MAPKLLQSFEDVAKRASYRLKRGRSTTVVNDENVDVNAIASTPPPKRQPLLELMAATRTNLVQPPDAAPAFAADPTAPTALPTAAPTTAPAEGQLGRMEMMMQALIDQATVDKEWKDSMKQAQNDMNCKVSELSKDLGQALTSIPELIEEKIKESEAVKECKTELNSMRDLNEAYRQAINKQQRKDVECLGKLTGYPQDWKKKEDFMKNEVMAEILGVCEIEPWIRRDGSGVGVAIIKYSSVQARKDACDRSKTKRLKINDRNVILGWCKTEMDLH